MSYVSYNVRKPLKGCCSADETESQIKRKLNELVVQKQTLELKGDDVPQDQIDRLEDQIFLLEWVLNEPIGKYHA